MLFNSFHFMVFLPVVALIYFMITPKFRWIWLLVTSYYFYMCWNPKYALLIATSTVITYLSGILISSADCITDEIKRKKVKKLYVFLSLFINLGILFIFKYYGFFSTTVIRVLSVFNISITLPTFDLLLPVGISFYTFQALSYTIDVYRGDIKAEKNIGKYALFVSFFPQLVAGPIEKSKDLLNQFNEVHSFDYYRTRDGLMLMLWGFFQKIVVADRLAVLVNTVYNNPSDYAGLQIIIATVFFAFQIYCDFASYSNIAIGVAQILGYKLTVNFRQPYFSKSIKEFWRRWHITLGAWFRDYLYIPLGGNRKGKIRNYINIMIVFLCSGLWHGASINFVIWGGLHGVYQIIGNILKPLKAKIIDKWNISINVFSYKFIQALITFILVNFAWIFFRANSFEDAIVLIRNIFVYNPWVITDGSLLTLGLDAKDFIVAIIAILIVVVIDYIQTRTRLRENITKQNLVFRWSVYIGIIMIIMILGIYGPEYSAQQFIYFQF